MRVLFARLVDTFRRRRLDRELETEIAVHLDMAAADMEAGGMSREAARRAALKKFGGVAQTKEADRDVRGFRMLEDLRADVRHALRGFRRTPASTCALVLTLALGIGVTTAVFSVVYGVLLKPLPFEEPDRLVAVNHRLPGFGVPRNGPQSEATYFTYRDHARAFEDIGVWRAMDVSVSDRGTAERIRALRVSDGLMPLLRVRPFLGRLIGREDDAPGAPGVVVLTYSYWASAFGAARDTLGRSLNIDGAPHEVIGVLPASFIFLNTAPQVVLPLKLDRSQAHPGSGFSPHGIARLNPGVTLAQASDDITRIIPLIAEQFPLQPGVTRAMWESVGLAPDLRPLADEVIGDTRRFLWILLSAAGIVLLIACANVANLLLVRGEGRQQEFAVRGALGASRGRIAGALVSESLILGLGGGALGVLVAQALLGLLRQTAPSELPRASEIGIDGVVLLFTLTLSIVTVLTSAFLPALKFGRLSVDALKDDGRATSAAPGRHRTRSALVVAQIALALVLLTVSGLMLRTFVFMRQVDPGFARPSEVQTFRIALPADLARDPEQVLRTYEQIVERLNQVQGVDGVGFTSHITMDRPQAGGGPFYVKDRPVAGRPTLRRVHTVAPGYIEAMGKLVVAGRTVTGADVAARRPIALVSANLAREWFGTPDKALGQQIGVGDYWLEIVGVVGDERDDGVNQPAPSIVYVSIGSIQSWGTTARGSAPTPPRSMAYVVRTARVGSPGFLSELKHAVQSVNPELPLANVRTLAEIQAVSMAQTSFAMMLLGIAAGVALLLALVGVYGVVAYIAAERTHEVGIRMALGAQESDVRRLLLRHGMVLALTGIGCGLIAAALVTPMMSAMLYGVRPLDSVTYVGVAVVLAAVTLLATYLPARRASLLQPTIALRSGA
jgi:predicted permease